MTYHDKRGKFCGQDQAHAVVRDGARMRVVRHLVPWDQVDLADNADANTEKVDDNRLSGRFFQLSELFGESEVGDMVSAAVRWIQDNGDSDTAPSACFATATTDEVANGLSIRPDVAYKALSDGAKKKKLITKREMRKHPSAHGTYSSKDRAIGWRVWEVKLRPDQCGE